MKKLFNYLVLFSMLLFNGLFGACRPERDPENVITDDQGVKMEVMWFNDSPDPTTGTSISIQVDYGKFYLATDNFFIYGSKSLPKLPDGDYDLIVRIDAVDRPTNYVVSITGQGTAKNYWAEFGPVNVQDLHAEFRPLKLRIDGNQYTLLKK